MGYGDLQISGVSTVTWPGVWRLLTALTCRLLSLKNVSSQTFHSGKFILFAVWRQCETCQSWVDDWTWWTWRSFPTNDSMILWFYDSVNHLILVTFPARISHSYFVELQTVEEFSLLLSMASAASDHVAYPLIIKSGVRDMFLLSILDNNLHFRYDFLFSFSFLPWFLFLFTSFFSDIGLQLWKLVTKRLRKGLNAELQ